MDLPTALAIIGSSGAACATLFASIKHFKKPDNTWETPFRQIEKRIDRFEREHNQELHALESRVTKAETLLDGMAEIKKDLDKLDEKMDNLVRIMLEFTNK